MTKDQETQKREILTLAYNNHQKELNSYALFKVSCPMTSRDLTQDTFLKTWKYLAKGGEIVTMKAFLYNVLNNLIVDEYRKRKTSSLDALIEKGFDLGDNGLMNFFDVLDGKAALFLVELLPKKYRDVMKLRYMQDLSLKEISTLTKQPRNTVTVQIYRGLAKIRSLYKY